MLEHTVVLPRRAIEHLFSGLCGVRYYVIVMYDPMQGSRLWISRFGLPLIQKNDVCGVRTSCTASDVPSSIIEGEGKMHVVPVAAETMYWRAVTRVDVFWWRLVVFNGMSRLMLMKS